MVYWWNRNYSSIDKDGQKKYSQEYLSMNQEQKAKGSFVFWDVEARCHDYEAIYDWVEKNKLDVDKYNEAERLKMETMGPSE